MVKRTVKQHKPSEVWKKYKVASGKITEKAKTCPKCGPGNFLGVHADRVYCGKCGYMEKVKK